MKIIKNENTIFCDIDETLVMHNKLKKDLTVICPYTNAEEKLTIHKAHVRQIIKNKARGNFVVVWSHAGYKWAEVVIKALNLTDYVDLIITKPIKIIDDLQPNEFLANRVYLSFEEENE